MVTLPFLYRMRHSAFYRRIIPHAVSLLIIAVALVWFTQRAFGIVLVRGIPGA